MNIDDILYESDIERKIWWGLSFRELLYCKIIGFVGWPACRVIPHLKMEICLKIILLPCLKTRQHKLQACICISHVGLYGGLFQIWEFLVQFLRIYLTFLPVSYWLLNAIDSDYFSMHVVLRLDKLSVYVFFGSIRLCCITIIIYHPFMKWNMLCWLPCFWVQLCLLTLFVFSLSFLNLSILQFGFFFWLPIWEKSFGVLLFTCTPPVNSNYPCLSCL